MKFQRSKKYYFTLPVLGIINIYNVVSFTCNLRKVNNSDYFLKLFMMLFKVTKSNFYHQLFFVEKP